MARAEASLAVSAGLDWGVRPPPQGEGSRGRALGWVAGDVSTTMQTPESSFPPAYHAQQVAAKPPANLPKELSPQVLGVSLVIMGSELGARRIPQIHTASACLGHMAQTLPHTGCVELCTHSRSKTVPLLALRARVLGSNPAPTT